MFGLRVCRVVRVSSTRIVSQEIEVHHVSGNGFSFESLHFGDILSSQVRYVVLDNIDG